MLKQLTIKNLAIIDDITIDFEENFNVLTGETGAGKSIIIDAIGYIFGQRASNEMIAYGKEQATIQAALYLREDVAKYISETYDIDVTDECILTRVISRNGKSTCKINGVLVPLHDIQEISPLLIDISSQNESQFLFNHKNHLMLLDKYIESKEANFKTNYETLFKNYKEIKTNYETLKSTSIDEGVLEFLNYKYQELKDFNYSVEDVYNIQEEYKQLETLRNNATVFEEIGNYLANDTNGSTNQLYAAIKQLSRLSSNTKVNEYYEKFNSIYLDLVDLVDDFNKDFTTEGIDLNRIEELSDDITKINRLKRKYQTEDILAYKKQIEQKIDLFNNREVELSHLSKLLNEAKDSCLKEASKVAKIREKYAIELASLVKQELADLYLNDASFSIRFNNLEELNINGNEDAEFYMSTNKGVEERPLIKVASGGEVSRIMLGLKSVFTKLALVDTIIFDEIDTGVSGKVALSMGKKMEKIAKDAQVLSITHLPQVAAMSDHHFYISKEVVNDVTRTKVTPLDNNQKVNEVARLLSGNEISESFISAAKDLIKLK